jgi:hypothetical protein
MLEIEHSSAECEKSRSCSDSILQKIGWQDTIWAITFFKMNIVSVIGPEMKASNVVIWKIYCIVYQSGAIIRLSAFEQRHWQLARKSNPFWQSGKIRHSTTVQMLLVFSCDVFVILLEEWSQQFRKELVLPDSIVGRLEFRRELRLCLVRAEPVTKNPHNINPFPFGWRVVRGRITFHGVYEGSGWQWRRVLMSKCGATFYSSEQKKMCKYHFGAWQLSLENWNRFKSDDSAIVYLFIKE